MDAIKVIPHHILICAATGRGKSNLVKNMLWKLINTKRVGMLILDSHDEYFGRENKGLNAHRDAPTNLIYYSVNPPPGSPRLIINLQSLRVEHFEGIVHFSDAQLQIINDYVQQYNDGWIESIIRELPLQGANMAKIANSISVLQRKFRSTLSVFLNNNGHIECRNRVFSTT